MYICNKPENYVELYQRMGCTDLMLEFQHKWDNIGAMCRVVHPSKAYFLKIGKGLGKDLIYCGQHKASHRTLVGIEDDNVKEVISKCPMTGKTKRHPRYYDKGVLGDLVQPVRTEIGADGSKVEVGTPGWTIWQDIYQARIIHFLQYLWDPDVLNYTKKYNADRAGFQGTSADEKEKFIKAFIPLLEIDTADTVGINREQEKIGTNNDKRTIVIESEGVKDGGTKSVIGENNTIKIESVINKEREKRIDMFNKEVFDQFVIMDGYVRDRFKSIFGVGGFWKHFSGNGLYYIGRPISVKSVEELNKVKQDFVYGICQNMIDYFEESGNRKIDKAGFDIPWPAWNSYYKIPFSLHKRYDRVSIPLEKDKDLDYEYIKMYSNPNNLNADVCKDLWKKGGY